MNCDQSPKASSIRRTVLRPQAMFVNGAPLTGHSAPGDSATVERNLEALSADSFEDAWGSYRRQKDRLIP